MADRIRTDFGSLNNNDLLLQYAPIKDGIPGPWTQVDVMSVKSAFKITGLTPAIVYAFRVQALGTVNRSDWSDPVTIMCT